MKLLDPNLLRLTPDGWAMIAQQCRDCGKVAYPRKRVCPRCFGENLAEHPLSRTGVLHTYARTYVGVPRIGLPYTIGFVDVPEGIRLFGLVLVEEGDVLEPGQSMEIVLGSLWRDEGGEDVVCYKFRPAAIGGRR